MDSHIDFDLYDKTKKEDIMLKLIQANSHYQNVVELDNKGGKIFYL